MRIEAPTGRNQFSFCGNVLTDLGLILKFGVLDYAPLGFRNYPRSYTGLRPVLVISPRWGLKMHYRIVRHQDFKPRLVSANTGKSYSRFQSDSPDTVMTTILVTTPSRTHVSPVSTLLISTKFCRNLPLRSGVPEKRPAKRDPLLLHVS